MRISSVNIGAVERIGQGEKTLTTGICKRPHDGPVHIGKAGLNGDSIVDEKHHGGADQAVYAYSGDDYRWWSQTLGQDCAPGLFGENLTIDSLPRNPAIGDRLLIGDVVLEVTSARIPCGTLAARMQDPGFGLAFRKAERPGVYLRVLNAGEVTAGDAVTLVEAPSGSVTALDLFRFAYETTHDAERLRQFLDAPVAERIRLQVEAALARLGHEVTA
ncbi:MAG: MOSC domain-containing protein [Woeseiaceae bacterium]